MIAECGVAGEGGSEGFARGGFDGDLPGDTAAGVLMKSWLGRRKPEFGVFLELGVDFLDFGNGGFFGFVGDREAGEVGKGR